MTVGSLFSGIGGLDLGLERAGMEIRWQVEIDPFCLRVLEKHWPGVKRYGDIRELQGTELEPTDLVCGGFPCQDVSVAGKRAGLAGERSGLWWEFHRIINTLTPRWVLIENVPGLLSSNRGWDFKAIIDSLVELGYGVAWRILDAQYFGVAQRRRRVFIVGCFGNGRCAAEVLFEPESVYGNPPKGREERTNVADIFATSSDGSGKESAISPTLDARAGDGPRRNQGGMIILMSPSMIANSITTREGQRQNPTTEIYVIQDVRGIDKNQHGIGINKNGPCYTLDGVSQHGVVAPTLRGFGHGWQGQHNDDVAQLGLVRRLTPCECERLQGFPDDWTLIDVDASDSPRYRALGNAVCVNVAEWIGRRIMEAEMRKEA